MILDGFLDTVRALLADEKTMAAFLREFAGTNVNFARHCDGSHFARLVRAVGQKAAVRLREAFAGECVYVPRNAADERAKRDEEIRARVAAGESFADVAKSYRQIVTLSERTVRRIASGVSKRQVVTRKKHMAETTE